MPADFHRVTTVALPPRSAIARIWPTVDLTDAYAITLPAGASSDPLLLARFLFGGQARWVRGLMAMRDALVGGLGLKTARRLTATATARGRVGIFRIYGDSAAEVVLGEDDRHLDFRISVLVADERRLIVSTVVHCHNRLGRVYLFCIAPFHRLIVPSTLRRAARAGWPR